MSDIGEVLKKLRGKMSLREASEKIGISHTYLDTIEKGFDKRSGKQINPSPETLKLISKAYNYSYKKLLNLAGYIDITNNEENEDPEFEEFIKDVRRWYKEAPKDREEDLQRLRRIFEAYKND